MKEKSSVPGIWLKFVLLVAGVVLLSLLSVSLWQEKPDKPGESAPLVLREGMTISEFGRENNLPNEVLQKAFGLPGKEDLEKKLEGLNLPAAEITARAAKAQVLAAEYESKNWFKIPLKFALWTLFMVGVFVLMRRRKITPGLRKGLYLAAMVLFGVILGADPGPMGTVKDAIALYGEKGVIFPPRMIALTVFLLMVVLANKFICAWGCQVGTLQDLIFRLNRNRKDTKGLLRQFRPSFAWTNGFRIAFFTLFSVVAFAWAMDIFETIDPFKIYKPAMIGMGGVIFIGLILVGSLFVYRPWCHLFCPFGLIGWLLEKISLFKIRVNYDSCIACGACEKACPSTVMGAILKRERVLPDCFACANCIDVCPTKSISLSTGKRSLPPAGKFKAEA
jgi:NAD-dependent dihydropyrimidine dehydrogenase PreA subunit